MGRAGSSLLSSSVALVARSDSCDAHPCLLRPMSFRRFLIVATLAASTHALGGRRNKDKEGAAAMRQELEDEATMQVEQDAMGANVGGARDYELENMAKHRAGELNDAELGLANMK